MQSSKKMIRTHDCNGNDTDEIKNPYDHTSCMLTEDQLPKHTMSLDPCNQGAIVGDCKFNKGDIVKHRLNRNKMIVVRTDAECPYPIECRWYNEKEDTWKTENFMPEELIIFRGR